MSYEIRKSDSTSVDREYKEMLQRLIEIGMGTNKKVENIERDIDSVKEDLGTVRTRVDRIEYSEEITYEQQNMINSVISKRVYQVLGLSPSPSKWNEEEQLTYAKYGRTFRRRLRSEVANKGHLAFPFRTTAKGNYDAACKDIEAWRPRGGEDELKAEIDKRAEANRIAKEQGYE